MIVDLLLVVFSLCEQLRRCRETLRPRPVAPPLMLVSAASVVGNLDISVSLPCRQRQYVPLAVLLHFHRFAIPLPSGLVLPFPPDCFNIAVPSGTLPFSVCCTGCRI